MNVGHYRLIAHQGPGYPGDWYEAEDESVGRRVRVLTLCNEDRATPAWERMQRRLRILEQLKHSSAVPLVELNLDAKKPYAVLLEPRGVPLDEVLRRREHWPEHSVLVLGRGLASVLESAHRLGLQHGRLEPSEIWLDEIGEPSLCFGGAGEWGSQDDVYALGMILFRLVHGMNVTAPAIRSGFDELREVESLADLIELMRAEEPEARPTSAEVHVWFRNLIGDSDHHHDIGSTLYGEAPPRLEPTKHPVQRRLGRFRVMEKLGEGGIGVVYRGEDSVDGQPVALKVLHPHHLQSKHIVRRFQKEARLLAEIRSPYVCRLIEFNEDGGQCFLAMEYLEGQTLGAVLDRKPLLRERDALTLAADAARALGEAHRRGIVHRDLKPDNLIVSPTTATYLLASSDGRFSETLGVKLCDFGLARHVEQTATLAMTHAEVPLGTPLYMAPEQAGAGDITPRSDVYALGVMLFQMLTGRTPFQANTIAGLIAKHAHEEAPSVHDLNPALSPALGLVVQKALAKNPLARYADADEFLLDLDRLLRGEPTNLAVHPALPAFEPGDVLHYDWSWELKASPEQLWPHVSNTERLNREVGLPAAEYTTQVGATAAATLGPRIDRFGTFRKLGVTNTWQEHPFEWIEGRRMGVLREYREGIFKWLVTVTELLPRAGGGTTLHHRVRILPRGLLGRVAAALEVGYKGRRAVDRVYRRIDAFLTGTPQSAAVDPFSARADKPVSDAGTFHRLVDQLAARGVAPRVAEGLVEYFLKAPEQEIARLRPIALAERLGLDEGAVIDACLIAAHEGILEVLWDILCPRCRIASAIEETMKSIKSHGYCEACHLDFELDFANSVEMILRVHPSLRKSELKTYCIGGPSHSRHVVAQVRVAAGERLELALELPEGSYRLRGPQLPYAVEVRVHPEARAVRGELRLVRGPGADFPRTFRTG